MAKITISFNAELPRGYVLWKMKEAIEEAVLHGGMIGELERAGVKVGFDEVPEISIEENNQ
jgi:hypothetical protein